MQNLKQKSNQRTKAFVNKINTLYDSIWGKEKPISIHATNEAKELAQTIKDYRSEAKRKIFLKGLDPKIKEELRPRMKREQTFEEICELAYAAESIVVNMHLLDDQKNDPLLASVKESQNKLETKIQDMEKQMQAIKSNNPSQEKEKTTIAALVQTKKSDQQVRQDGTFLHPNQVIVHQNRGRGGQRFQGRPFNQRSRGGGYGKTYIPSYQPQTFFYPSPYYSQGQTQYNPNQYQKQYFQPSQTQGPQISPTQQNSERPTLAIQGQPVFQFNQNPQAIRTCHNCKQPGHYIKACPHPIQKQKTQ